MAWHRYFALGVVAVAAVACTVSSGDGSSDDGLGTGGDAGSGGAMGGSAGATGGGSGGTAGGSGGSGNGGSGATTGGSAGSGGSGGAMATCDPATDDDACGSCVKQKCCDEWLACTDVECGGTMTEDGEVQCVIKCMYEINGDAGSVDESDLASCAIACAQGGDDLIAVTSDELITCMNSVPDDGGGMKNCAEECFNLF